jgi:subtilisin family serine protease
MPSITINGISFDPEGSSVQLAGLEQSDTSNSNYIIIQSNAPLTKDQKDELNSLGAQILEFYPENSYLCKFSPSSVEPIKALPYVVFASVYPKEVKIGLALRSDSSDKTAEVNLLSLDSVETSMSQQPYKVDIILHNEVSSDSIREDIARAVGLDPQDIIFSRNKVRLLVRPQDLEDLAAIDEVKFIQPVEEYRLCNNVALGILQADQVHRDFNLKGEGQIIAICDTGFDKGSTTDVHPGFKDRVLKLYDMGRPGKSNDPNGHGTHVAGSVLGDGFSTTMGESISGIAPSANLIFQSVLDARGGLSGLPQDLNDLFIVPYRDDNARVHTNSWGVPVKGNYTQDSQEVDEFVYSHRACVNTSTMTINKFIYFLRVLCVIAFNWNSPRICMYSSIVISIRYDKQII